MSKPLEGRRILLTRDPGGPLQKLLEGYGAEVVVIPVIELVDPPSWQPFDTAAQDQSSFQYALFTSKEGVARSLARLQRLRETLSPHLTLAAVGSQTAKLLKQAGYPVRLVPTDFQAEGLMRLFEPLDLQSRGVWFPRALEAREDLTQFLSARGARLVLTPVYQNIIPYRFAPQIKKTLQASAVDWIAFTSSSTVKNLLELLGKKPHNQIKLASIGKITSSELAQQDLTATVTAQPQTLAGLAKAILEFEHHA